MEPLLSLQPDWVDCSRVFGTCSGPQWTLEAFVECCRTELSDFGIGFCLIEPWGMPTAFFDGMIAPNDAAHKAEYNSFATLPAKFNRGLTGMLDLKAR